MKDSTIEQLENQVRMLTKRIEDLEKELSSLKGEEIKSKLKTSKSASMMRNKVEIR